MPSSVPRHSRLSIQTRDGQMLLELKDWSMSVPNRKDGDAGMLHDLRPVETQPFDQVSATFAAPADEH